MSGQPGRPRSDTPAASDEGGRGLVLFWTATSVSQVGDEVYTLAIPLIAYAAFRSAPAMTFLYGVSMLPHLVFGIAGGAWADRSGRKLPILSLSAVACLILAGLAVLILRQPPTLAMLAAGVFLLSVVTSALLASYDGALNDVVRPQARLRMISALESSRTASVILGPALAGALFMIWHGALPLLADAASFALAAVIIAWVPFRRRAEPAGAAGAGGPGTPGMAGMITGGIGYAWRVGRIRFGILLSSANNLVLSSLEILVVFRLRGSLHASGAVTGLIFSAGGACALLTALVMPRFAGRAGLRAAMTAGMAGIGVSALGLGLAPDIVAVGAAQCLGTSSSSAFNIAWRTHRQNTCDPVMISRISGVCRGIAYCCVTIGAWLCSGLLAVGVPARTYLLAGGVIVCGLGAVTPRLLRERPAAGRVTELQDEESTSVG
ncbi:MAG TPA: MFS transporter [Streptosporangiaceae bacterium]|jgi:MFS family permease